MNTCKVLTYGNQLLKTLTQNMLYRHGTFFNTLQTPTINTVHRTKTELPLQRTEIIDVIMTMQNCKAPGPEDYPIEFF